MRAPVRTVVCVATLGLVVASGCSSDGGDEFEAAPGWAAPGWMAQVRQQNEEFQNAMLACYAEHGLTAVRTMAGGVMFVNVPQDPATLQVHDEAAEDCNARVPLPGHKLDETLDDAAYQRMLDLRACIVAHGFEVSEPPSAQVWQDGRTVFDAWNPYAELINGPGSLDQATIFALEADCPQPGPNFIVLAPTGDG